MINTLLLLYGLLSFLSGGIVFLDMAIHMVADKEKLLKWWMVPPLVLLWPVVILGFYIADQPWKDR